MSSPSSVKSVRVRFAPSPTGFLHIGGARTALFNWLFARAMGGKFLLRIEDTDRERSEDRFTEDILESLKWLGFEPDEKPIFQSHRFPRYHELVEKLIAEGKAYKCDMTSEELDVLRKKAEAAKRPFRYPAENRDKKVDPAKPFVVRIKMPLEGETSFTDLIRGTITFQNRDLDDWVIQRADKAPTYNFTVVVDDFEQGITHVLRGDDHINNTPKQIQLYKLLGFAVPDFAHLPMILGQDKTKLSKRHGAASTLEYRKMGYLPLAITNFLVRLGWSHGDQEIFTIAELQKYFALDHIGKANAVFNPEKLSWVSGHFMRDTPPAEFFDYIQKYFSTEAAFLKPVPRGQVEKGIAIIQGKVKNVVELVEQLSCLFGEDPPYQSEGLKADEPAKFSDLLKELKPVLSSSSFTKEDLESRVRQQADAMKIKLSPLAQAMRFAVTGGKVSPGLFEMLELQGKDVVLRRVDKALSALAEKR